MYKRQVTWNGIIYNSIKAAAEDCGIPYTTMNYRINKGYTSDNDITAPSGYPIPCEWNGGYYDSILSAANACSIPERTMHKYVKLGYTCTNDIPHDRRGKSVLWNGQQYRSIVAAARDINISSATMSRYIELGYICDSDVPDNIYATIWNKVLYPSMSCAGHAIGISKVTMLFRVRKGYLCDDDMLIKRNLPRHLSKSDKQIIADYYDADNNMLISQCAKNYNTTPSRIFEAINEYSMLGIREELFNEFRYAEIY